MENLLQLDPEVLAAVINREVETLIRIVDQVRERHPMKKPPHSVKPKKKLEAYAGV